jgi:hypothetical protein
VQTEPEARGKRSEQGLCVVMRSSRFASKKQKQPKKMQPTNLPEATGLEQKSALKWWSDQGDKAEVKRWCVDRK